MSVVLERLAQVCANKRRKAEVAEAVGWTPEMLDKLRLGACGVPLDKLPALINALELHLFTKEYADYLARGNVIGSNCLCARLGNGECGRGQVISVREVA